ncbi:MAG: diguanylate cyclase [Spongiibacteraceae bacterium]
MKLSQKILLLLSIITLIGFGTAVYVEHNSVQPTLQGLEAKSDQKDIKRVLLGLDLIRDKISTITSNYALRDETYSFFQNQNKNYLDTNFNTDNLSNLEIDLVILADNQNYILASKLIDSNQDEVISTENFNAEELIPLMADSSLARPNAPILSSGIAHTSFGYIIFSSYSVLKTDLTGVSPGSLLLAKRIDEELIANIQTLTKVNFSISDITPKETSELLNKKINDHRRNNNNQIDWYLTDINDQPVIKITLQLDQRVFHSSFITSPLLAGVIVALASWLVVLLFIHRTLTRPLLNIGQHLLKIRQYDDYSLRLNSKRKDEIGTLSNECDRLLHYVEHQTQLVKQQSLELHRLSFEDSLTGLPNRRRFDQLLDDYWKLCRRDHRPISLIMCDIDYFKQYNDNYGHLLGDNILQKVAKILKSSLQRETDFCARYGGEEFAIILPGTNQTDALAIGVKLQHLLEQAAIPHYHSKVKPVLTMSMGIATLTPHSDRRNKPELLISQADYALYQAKDNGRNKINCAEQLINHC